MPCGWRNGQPSLRGPGSRSRQAGPGLLGSAPRGWDRSLPSSVLGAMQAQKPPDVSRPACPLMGRKWAGARGTDEPGRRAPRQRSQADVGITHPLLTELALALCAPTERLRGGPGSEWRDPGWAGVRACGLSLVL